MTNSAMTDGNNKLLIDIGSTYFKISTFDAIEQHFRDFEKDILDALMAKCGETMSRFGRKDIQCPPYQI